LKERSPKKEHVSKYASTQDKPLEKHHTFRILTPKSVLPLQQEVHRNIRARSAKLRAAIRTEILGEETCVPQLC
jgi:16S rRNA C1402 N4-methylase RsmH